MGREWCYIPELPTHIVYGRLETQDSRKNRLPNGYDSSPLLRERDKTESGNLYLLGKPSVDFIVPQAADFHMPEGHTIHRIARDHQRAFSGQKLIVTSPQGRFEDEAAMLSGRKLKNVSAHGKHLFYHWTPKRGSGDLANLVHVHLGLYGKFRLHKNPAPEPRGAVRVRMIGDEKAFDLNGPTRCELLSKDDYKKLLDRLGQDPLNPEADPEVVWHRIHRSRAAIGTLLLNQSVIAGLGNIYRAEILFLTGTHPEQSGSSLSRDQFDKIWKLSVDLLKIGVRYNRIITVDPTQLGKSASRLKRDERLLVYKKLHCTACGAKIRKWTLGARTMYACEKCQRRS